jgi:hypothetical protein
MVNLDTIPVLQGASVRRDLVTYLVVAPTVILYNGFPTAAVGPPVAYRETYTPGPVPRISYPPAADRIYGRDGRMAGPDKGFYNRDG